MKKRRSEFGKDIWECRTRIVWTDRAVQPGDIIEEEDFLALGRGGARCLAHIGVLVLKGCIIGVLWNYRLRKELTHRQQMQSVLEDAKKQAENANQA